MTVTSRYHERLYALRAVSGIALLLGIVLHAAMSYLPGLIEAGWPIADSSQSGLLKIVYFVIHIFRMSTFFLIAGVFAHLAYRRRGPRQFIQNRRNRILLPLLYAYAPVVLAVVLIMNWAAQNNTAAASVLVLAYQDPDRILPFPLMHFWFLYILVWLYPMILLLRGLVAGLDKKQRIRLFIDRQLVRLFQSYLAPFVLAVPIAIALFNIPSWLWWAGIPAPDYSLDPVWSTLMIYFYVFCLGWLLERQRRLLSILRRQWILNLALGLLATIACLTIAGWESDILSKAVPEKKLIYAVSYSVAILALSFSLIGAGMAFFRVGNPVIRYLSDASYWMYLCHLPVVFAFQALFMNIEMTWVIKFPLILFLTCVLLVISYDWFVRSTKVGERMNGRRYPRGLPQKQSLLQNS